MPTAQAQEKRLKKPLPATINSSHPFAEAAKIAAEAEGVTIGALLDRLYLSDLQDRAAKALRKRLTSLEQKKASA